MEINNKHIVITGASSGIGLELLKILSKYKEVKIIAVARHTESIPISDKIIPFSADLSTPEGVNRLFSYIEQTIGQIDIFIANAGFAYLEKIGKANWQHIQSIYNLNVFSPIYSLEKYIQSGNKGLFVSTVSGAGLVSLPAYSLYCSTKAALHHFMKTFSYECPADIKLMNVYPVATRTDFFDKASNEDGTPLPWPTQKPETVAKSIIRGIEKNKKTVYPSTLFRLFYPIGRAFPFTLRIYSLLEKKKVKQWIG